MNATGSSVIFLGQANGSDSAAICLQEHLNPSLRLKLAQSIQSAVARNSDLQESFAAMLNAAVLKETKNGFTIFKFLLKKSEQTDSAVARCLTKRVAAAIALLESPLRDKAMELLIDVAHIPYKQLPKGADAAANYARQYVYRANLNALRTGRVAA